MGSSAAAALGGWANIRSPDRGRAAQYYARDPAGRNSGASLRLQRHPLRTDEAVDVGREALEARGRAPDPLDVEKKDIGVVGEIEARGVLVEFEPLSGRRHVTRVGERLVHFRVAVVAPIERAVALQPDIDVAVGIRPA